MPTPAATRKRSRAQLRAVEPEEEQDELSPEKSVIGGKKLSTPLSAAKRRKLNGSSPAPASKTVIGSLGKRVGTAIGDLMGWGSKKGKENVAQEEVDELADDEEGSGRKEKDIWEVDTSEPEETVKRSARVKKLNDSGRMSAASTPKTKEKATTPAKVGTKSKRKIVTAGELAEDKSGDIWEVEVSDPENGTPVSLPVRKGMPSVQRAKTFLSPATKDAMADIPKKRSAGRPKKSDILKKASVAAKQAIRESLIAGGSAVADEEAEEEGVADTQSRRKSGLGRKEDTQADVDPQPELVSSAKKRGRPKKNLDGVIDSVKKDPKGILTPSKKDKTLRSRKSVAFEENDAEMDLGFKDIPSSANSKLKTVAKLKKKPAEKGVETEEPYDASAEAQEEPASEDERSNGEEIACSICNGLDSKKGNQIILCDNCDFALHLKCYGLSKVPKGDWYCKDCEPEVEEEVSFPLLNEGLNDNETSGDLPDIENFEDHLRNVQRIVLDNVTGQKRIKLCGHDEEMQKVHQVVEQTVLAGEGNSMLVIGARGCGKTTLVESVISDLSRDHRDSFHVVRLNGFIHTDDKLALKEIWRQLGREMEVEDDVAGRKSNYADTLASLLALLSHPSEISESEPGQTAKSVVFILDEFDLFATHPRQTLLYNLFDIAQARKAPIVVLGLTTRIDVVESLEKRVKSRFSHRYVHLSLPRSIPAFWEICKQGLLVDAEEMDTDVDGKEGFLAFWQSMIEDLYNKDNTFKHYVQSLFYRSKSVPGFFTSCILPIANLSPKNLPLTGKKFTCSALSLSAPDSKLQLLQGLSELELALLIAAARLDIILDTDTCNFAMAYDEYSSLTSRHKVQTSSTGITALGANAKVWGRDVALGSWERLEDYDLLVPAGIGGGGARDSGAGGRMWKVDVGLEEITGSVEGLSGVMTKWCREI